jgi:hypothetical protein
LGLVLALPWLGPAATGAAGGIACAADRPHAALVVDTGAQTTTYCVGLDAGTVNGLHLIQLAAAQYGLTYRLGFGGQAVCQLNGTGSTSGDCFGDYPDFWGYWHGDGHGGWTWAGSGAGSAVVGDGAVEGWSWGQGDSGTTHPSPPRQRFQDVCTVATPTPSPKPTTAPSPHATPSHTPPAGGASAVATPVSTSSPHGTTSPRPHAAPSTHVTPSPSPTDDIVRAEATAGRVPSSGGPPAGALVALVAIVLLCAGGWRSLRRRRGEERG